MTSAVAVAYPENVGAEAVPVTRAQWIDLVLRSDIPSQRKAVAFALCSFANPDGTRVFPGQQKVADMAGLHVRNARKHIKALASSGMLIVVRHGGGRGGATNAYRLSRPANITTLPLWLDPDMNRVDATTKHRAPAPGEKADDPTDEGVDNPETPAASALLSEGAEEETPGVLNRNTGRSVQEYGALAPTDQPSTNPRPTQHPAGSTKATHLLALVPPIRNDDGLITVSEMPPDPGFDAARTALAALPRFTADVWRHAARTELEATGERLTKRAVEIRAAALANERPTKGAQTA